MVAGLAISEIWCLWWIQVTTHNLRSSQTCTHRCPKAMSLGLCSSTLQSPTWLARRLATRTNLRSSLKGWNTCAKLTQRHGPSLLIKKLGPPMYQQYFYIYIYIHILYIWYIYIYFIISYNLSLSIYIYNIMYICIIIFYIYIIWCMCIYIYIYIMYICSKYFRTCWTNDI